MGLHLIDTNVLVAAAVRQHPHHTPSLRLLEHGRALSVVSHSVTETYNTLTRRSFGRGYAYAPGLAIAALETVLVGIEQLALTADETLVAIRRFAGVGGVGPRLYDALIGEVARVNGFETIATWNVGHMRALFPDLRVATPAELAAAG